MKEKKRKPYFTPRLLKAESIGGVVEILMKAWPEWKKVVGSVVIRRLNRKLMR